GSGYSKVTVNKPLMARPALPRVLRAGDRFKAAVVVSTKDAKSSLVSVSLDVTGAGLTGKRTQQVRVVPTGVAEVSFDVEAPVAGDAVFTFGLQGTAERDTVRISRSVL